MGCLGVLCLSLIVVTIDTTILNVALPTLVDSLHASSSALQWIVDGYTVVFAGLLLTAGSLGDRFGRRGALSAGLAIFGLASAASALATNTTELIALRGLTGVGAALVFPATLSIIANVFPDPRERQRAIAVWAGTAGIGIGLGPVAGGLLLRWFYWGSVFWVNVPVCAWRWSVALRRAHVPRHRREPARPPGAVLSIRRTVGARLRHHRRTETRGWTSRGGRRAVRRSLVVLVRSPSRRCAGVGRRCSTSGCSATRGSAPRASSVTALYFCLFGTIFFQTQHLQFVLGYDPLGAGLRSLPFAVVLLVVANTTPRLVRWAGTAR